MPEPETIARVVALMGVLAVLSALVAVIGWILHL